MPNGKSSHKRDTGASCEWHGVKMSQFAEHILDQVRTDEACEGWEEGLVSVEDKNQQS